MVVAETFEQARAAAYLIRVDYQPEPGKFDLAAEAPNAPLVGATAARAAAAPPEARVGDFEGAFAAAPVKLDETYTTPDESHAMMEPHATIAAWEGDRLTLWTSNQMIAWGKGSIAKILGIPAENVRLDSPYIGGGFGGKAVHPGRRRAGRARREGGAAAGQGGAHPPARSPTIPPIGLPRSSASASARPATARSRPSRMRAPPAIWPSGKPETAVSQTRLLYAGANRLTAMRLAPLDLPEGNAMRAPGEAPGMMALEVAMDEMAEKLGLDPVEFRILNDTQVDPEKSGPPLLPSRSRRMSSTWRRALRLGQAQSPAWPRCGTDAGSSGWAWRRASATTS